MQEDIKHKERFQAKQHSILKRENEAATLEKWRSLLEQAQMVADCGIGKRSENC
ncbi:hypothetical protein E2542_SST14062 [Spatholobus suberectus]|nr:hypothetical protein E2542_SST14062 [Spatholobus suberectus]